MVFSSNMFLFLFLPAVLGVYYILPKKCRNTVLLVFSLGFYYIGEPKLFYVIIASILVNYFFGLEIGSISTEGKGKKLKRRQIYKNLVLMMAVVANLGILFYFKYYNFAVESINSLRGGDFLTLRDIIMPIGISFFTFQGMTYIIDLYWGRVKVQKNPLKIGLYISLFPQLIAGPIVRYIDVETQINQREESVNLFSEGIRRFAIGLGKKAIIANTVALSADKVFAIPTDEMSMSIAWVGILCYTLQIYFDFSGYSDMAIGLGKMFGFEFKENFDYPYVSRSIKEFWRRWHISLSSFFRDYVYIPLGGNRKGNVYVNLLIVFFLTGLWHGASLNFIVWGLWHGMFILLERLYADKISAAIKIPNFIKHIYVILIFMVGWVFFRAENLTYAMEYISLMFTGGEAGREIGFTARYFVSNFAIFIIIIGMILSTGIYKKLEVKIDQSEHRIIFANVLSLVIFIISCFFVMVSTYNPFIYFRF